MFMEKIQLLPKYFKSKKNLYYRPSHVVVVVDLLIFVLLYDYEIFRFVKCPQQGRSQTFYSGGAKRKPGGGPSQL